MINKKTRIIVKTFITNDLNTLAFHVDLKNPLPYILQNRLRFFRKFGLTSNLYLFFEGPKQLLYFVYNRWCGECKHGKRFNLTVTNIKENKEKIISEFLDAYERCDQKWIEFRKQEKSEMEDDLLFEYEMRKASFTLLHGGISENSDSQ